MIYAFTGKTGSGKTYRMVHFAHDYWLQGVDIFSNTVLNFQPSRRFRLVNRLRRLFRRPELVTGRIVYFENINEILEVRNGLILFDEAQVLFNARSWESLPEEFQYKLQQHRKHRLDLFCTTQNMGTIDITYRRLVQFWYHHEPVWTLGDLTFGLFRAKMKDVDELYNSVDDLQVTDLGQSFFTIGSIFKWRKALYDTLYDIGFQRFRTVWITQYNPALNKMERKFYIIPKKQSLKDAQTAISSLTSSFRPRTSIGFRRT